MSQVHMSYTNQTGRATGKHPKQRPDNRNRNTNTLDA